MWLRRHEARHDSSAWIRLLDRLDRTKKLEGSTQDIKCMLPHRIAGLRRQRRRYCGDGMPDVAEMGQAPSAVVVVRAGSPRSEL